MAKSDLGEYFWRGGTRIELEREEEVFTALAESREALEQVRALSGVQSVERVQNGVFKVRVQRAQRDTAMQAYRTGDRAGVCHHAYHPKADAHTRYYLTDGIVARFGDAVPVDRIEALLAEYKLRVVREYPGGKTLLLRVGSDAGMNPIKLANTLAALDEVVYAEPNLINRYQGSYTPVDTHFSEQWHLSARDAVELVADADVSAPQAWDVTRGSREVVVAVVDDGFDLGHPDFAATGKLVQPKDYVDGDASPFPGGSDYHGTPCAGVAIAEENGEGVVGVAPGCAFMPVRFPLSSDDNALFDIFDFVGRHADVISCSWGPPPVHAPQSQLLRDKFTELATTGGRRKKGCVIVFAAGNYNAPLRDLNNTHFVWRHPQAGLVTTTGPIENGEAVHPQVIAVAASTSQNRKSAYSNWGQEISVAAPSNNFHPLDPSATVPGRGIWTTDNEQHGQDFTPGSRYTARFGGTSSATPLTAGIAALVISANPELSGPQVKAILEETADRIEDHNPDPVLGNQHGTYNNGHSLWFGRGKINAAAAVAEARARIAPDTAAAELSLDAADADNLAATGETRLYKVSVGAQLTVSLDGPSTGADFDVYVKRGSAPTVDDYDVRGYTSSASEKVTLDVGEPGDYYILVRSFEGSGAYSLRVGLD